jgi:hypothetical protein
MATRDLTGRFVQLREYRFGAAPRRTDDHNKVGLLEVRSDCQFNAGVLVPSLKKFDIRSASDSQPLQL